MEPINILKYLVLTLVLTTFIFIYLENKNNLQFPTLQEQLKKESKHRLFISLGISLIVVILMMILNKKKII